MKFEDYIKKNKLEEALISKKDWEFEVGWLVTEARLHTNLTQAQLARKMGTKQPSIARVENGKVIPSIEFLVKLAKAIGTRLILPRFDFINESVTKATTSSDAKKTEIVPEPIRPSQYFYLVKNSSSDKPSQLIVADEK